MAWISAQKSLELTRKDGISAGALNCRRQHSHDPSVERKAEV